MMDETMCMKHLQDRRFDETISENAKTANTRPKRICLVGYLAGDRNIVAAAQLFNVPVLKSETGEEFTDDESFTTYFILTDFEGPIFENINKHHKNHK